MKAIIFTNMCTLTILPNFSIFLISKWSLERRDFRNQLQISKFTVPPREYYQFVHKSFLGTVGWLTSCGNPNLVIENTMPLTCTINNYYSVLKRIQTTIRAKLIIYLQGHSENLLILKHPSQSPTSPEF